MMAASRLGLLGGLLAIGAAALLGAVATSNQSGLGPTPEIPTLALFTVLYGTPGVVGMIGALTGRRVLLVAAGVAYVVFSPLSFAGVTLIFLLPALLLFRAAVMPDWPAPARPMQPGRLLLAGIISTPIALWLVFHLGILTVLLAAVLGGLAQAFSRPADSAPLGLSARDAVVGLVVAALSIGAVFATFTLTETACWVAYDSPGGLVYQRVPPTDTTTGSVGGGDGSVASGCDSGRPSPQGIGLAGVLAVGAIALSALAAYPPASRKRTAQPAP
jgi:hypothetical protein